MRIYRVNADHDKYDACGIDFEACAKKHPELEEWEMLTALDGSSVADTWWPRKMNRYGELPIADYVSKLSGDVMILNRRSITKLQNMLNNAEILPLECDFGDYWAVNIMTVLNCIDYEKAEFKRFTSGKIMRFNKFAFRPEAIKGHHIFKIVDQPISHIFVDEVFLEEVAKHNITGFKFELVWEG